MYASFPETLLDVSITVHGLLVDLLSRQKPTIDSNGLNAFSLPV